MCKPFKDVRHTHVGGAGKYDKYPSVTADLLLQPERVLCNMHQVVVYVEESGEYPQLCLCTSTSETGSRGEFSRWVPCEVLAGKLELVDKQKQEMEEMVAMMKILKAQIEANERKYQQQYATVLEQGSLIRQLQAQVNSCRLLHPIYDRA